MALRALQRAARRELTKKGDRAFRDFGSCHDSFLRSSDLSRRNALLFDNIGNENIRKDEKEYDCFGSPFQFHKRRFSTLINKEILHERLCRHSFHHPHFPYRIQNFNSSPFFLNDDIKSTVTAQNVSKGADTESKEKYVENLAAECDEAVEDLSSIKARFKAANEAVRKGKGVIRASLLLAYEILSKLGDIIRSIGPGMVSVARMSRKDWEVKISGWYKHLKDELHRYWLGMKLLWTDVRISSRLLLKLANGKALTRRERQQLTRTSADIFRLVPFAVFIIIPFMEFALPLFLRLFPNMLPSTFQDKMKEEEKLKRRLKARLEMAKFLQETVGEMAKEVKSTKSGEAKRTAEELQKFITKVRTGSKVSNDKILKFASLFNDELTLDNISRPRLVSMCKYMGLQPFGTDAYLRYILRSKLAWIKEDDKLIQEEGVESLSESELRSACRERGMLGLLSVEEMRQQLIDWLDLSLNRAVPSSLLILSRSFLLGGRVKPEEAVQFTLSSLPDEVVEQVGMAVPTPSEEPLLDSQKKLELLKEQERLIKEEEDSAKARELLEKEEKRDVALEEMKLDHFPSSPTPPSAALDANEIAKKRAIEKKDALCKLSAALAVLSSASSVAKERAEFLQLVNKEINLYNSMVEEEAVESEEEAKSLYKAASQSKKKEGKGREEKKEKERETEKEEDEISSALIDKVDSMLHQLEKEIDAVDEKIGSKWQVLDLDRDGKVTPEEVAAAAAFLRDSLGQEPIHELIANLAKDQDGKILVDDIVKLGLKAETDEVVEDLPHKNKIDSNDAKV